MKKLLLVIVLGVLFFGCKSKDESNSRLSLDRKIIMVDTTTGMVTRLQSHIQLEQPLPDKKCVEEIFVNSCMVTNTIAYGYVSKASCLFSYSNCEKGYMLTVKKCDEIISNSFCPKNQLKKYLDIIRYEMSVKDSVAYKIPVK